MASFSAKALKSSNGVDGTLLEYMARYPTEEACEEALMAARFPDGWVCPRCGNRSCSPVSGRPRKRQCTRCGKQLSVTSGTAMESSKLPLRKWFLAFYLVTHSKRGMSALELARHLGVSEVTGRRVILRLRGAMAGSECLQAAALR